MSPTKEKNLDYGKVEEEEGKEREKDRRERGRKIEGREGQRRKRNVREKGERVERERSEERHPPLYSTRSVVFLFTRAKHIRLRSFDLSSPDQPRGSWRNVFSSRVLDM